MEGYHTVHMCVNATREIAIELASLSQNRLDEFWRQWAGFDIPIFYLGDGAWRPHFSR